MKRLLTLIAIVAALVLSACGDEDDEPETAAPPATPSQTESPGSDSQDPVATESEDNDVSSTGGVGAEDSGSASDESGGGISVGENDDDGSGTGGVGAYGD